MNRRARARVRRAEEFGCRAEVVPATPTLIEETRQLYEETMHRVGAADNYFFSSSYYTNLAKLGEQLQIARVLDDRGTCIAACFVLVDPDFAHNHLQGSTRSVLGMENLLLWSIFRWAAEVGLKGVHMGGGLSDGDSLFKFKSTFGGEVTRYSLGRSIIREDVYETLLAEHAREIGSTPSELSSGNFFPAYRVMKKDA